MCGASDKKNNNRKASSSCTSFSSSYSSSTDGLTYHHGFANHLESEAYPGALPQGRNNPRLVPHGLYTEQISGTAFTAPRNENRRTWLYRAQPSVSGTSNPFYACAGSSSDNSDDDIVKSFVTIGNTQRVRRLTRNVSFLKGYAAGKDEAEKTLHDLLGSKGCVIKVRIV